MKSKTVKENSRITFRDLWIVFWRWWLACEMSNSYERMQSIAYCFSMVPVLKKLYPNRDDFVEALQRHLIFFNTEGICGNVILGMTVAMEEEKAESQGAVSGESIVALKSALMGPVAGIGDTVTWGTVKPLVFTIALTASAEGSVLGWFLMFLFVPITVAYGWFLMVMGYRLGRNALSNLLELLADTSQGFHHQPYYLGRQHPGPVHGGRPGCLLCGYPAHWYLHERRCGDYLSEYSGRHRPRYDSAGSYHWYLLLQ